MTDCCLNTPQLEKKSPLLTLLCLLAVCPSWYKCVLPGTSVSFLVQTAPQAFMHTAIYSASLGWGSPLSRVGCGLGTLGVGQAKP